MVKNLLHVSWLFAKTLQTFFFFFFFFEKGLRAQSYKDKEWTKSVGKRPFILPVKLCSSSWRSIKGWKKRSDEEEVPSSSGHGPRLSSICLNSERGSQASHPVFCICGAKCSNYAEWELICQLRVFSGRSRQGPGATGLRGPGATSTATINSSLLETDLYTCCPSIIIRACFHSQMCPVWILYYMVTLATRTWHGVFFFFPYKIALTVPLGSLTRLFWTQLSHSQG